MTTQVQYRRGTAADHDAFVGVAGELTIVTDTRGIRIHDGVTPGGYHINHKDYPEILRNKTIIAADNNFVITQNDLSDLGFNFLAKDANDSTTAKSLNFSDQKATISFDTQSATDNRGIKRIQSSARGFAMASNAYMTDINGAWTTASAGSGAAAISMNTNQMPGQIDINVADIQTFADPNFGILWNTGISVKPDGVQIVGTGKLTAGNITATNVSLGAVGLNTYSSTRADITALVPGTTSGLLIESPDFSHVVVGLKKSNNANDSFTILGETTGSGNQDGYYDTKLFSVQADGKVYIPSGTLYLGTTPVSADNILATDINGNLSIPGTLTVGGTAVAPGSYLRSDADDTFTGKLSIGSTTARQSGIYGTYDSTKTGHIWSMGTAYAISSTGADFGNLYGFGYKHTNNATGGTMASGHQGVWVVNGTPTCALGTNIWTSGDVIAFSDERVKTNIERIPDALDKVKQLNGYTFDRTDVELDNQGKPTVPVRQTGVIAQEVLKVLPEAVRGGPTEEDPEGKYSVAYGNLVGLLIESIKQLEARVEELEKERK